VSTMLPDHDVSVVIACRNESEFIGACLESITASEYSGSIEVLVIDGLSDDETPQIVGRLAENNPTIRLLHNDKRITSAALNIGIRAARSPFVIWMNAHCVYPPDYIRNCIAWAEHSGAEVVGGRLLFHARSNGAWARGVIATQTHPFGVGNARFRFPVSTPRSVDTVFGGCIRKEVFDRIGIYNEALIRNQDMDFNLRVKRTGGTVLLVPGVTCTYFARTAPRAFVSHTFANGRWTILSFRYSKGMSVGMRHLVPICFLLAVSGLALLGLLGLGWLPLGSLASIYAGAAVLASVQKAEETRDPLMLAVTPLAFAVLHVSYGVGSVAGLAELVFRSALDMAGRFRLDSRAPGS
jgi:GT2 family glycosyltransferase